MSVLTLTLLASLALSAPPGTPAAGPEGSTVTATAAARTLSLPKGESRARYALKVMGQTIGEPSIQFGPLLKLKNGRKVRKMMFSSGISERLQRLYPADTQFVSVIDCATYKPMQASYNVLNGEVRDKTMLKFKGAKLSMAKSVDDKASEAEDTYEVGMTDSISSLAWISARGLNAGETVSSPHHSGSFRYRVYATGEEFEEVTVPAGTFRSLRVKFQLFLWPEGCPDAARDAVPRDREQYAEWTIWLTDDAWRTAVRIVAEVGILGNVDLQLTNRRLK